MFYHGWLDLVFRIIWSSRNSELKNWVDFSDDLCHHLFQVFRRFRFCCCCFFKGDSSLQNMTIFNISAYIGLDTTVCFRLELCYMLVSVFNLALIHLHKHEQVKSTWQTGRRKILNSEGPPLMAGPQTSQLECIACSTPCCSQPLLLYRTNWETFSFAK